MAFEQNLHPVAIPASGDLSAAQFKFTDIDSNGRMVIPTIQGQRALGVLQDKPNALGIQGEQPGWSLRAAMERIAAEDHGVVIVLRWDETPADVIEAAQALGRGPSKRAKGPVLRTYGIGAQILQDLGITRMRVLSAPKQLHGLSAFGLEVTSYVDLPSAALRAVSRSKA